MELEKQTALLIIALPRPFTPLVVTILCCLTLQCRCCCLQGQALSPGRGLHQPWWLLGCRQAWGWRRRRPPLLLHKEGHWGQLLRPHYRLQPSRYRQPLQHKRLYMLQLHNMVHA